MSAYSPEPREPLVGYRLGGSARVSRGSLRVERSGLLGNIKQRLGRLQRTLPKPDKYYDSVGRKSTEAADGQRARASERRPGSWVRPSEGVAGRSGLAGEVGGLREVLRATR